MGRMEGFVSVMLKYDKHVLECKNEKDLVFTMYMKDVT